MVKDDVVKEERPLVGAELVVELIAVVGPSAFAVVALVAVRIVGTIWESRSLQLARVQEVVQRHKGANIPVRFAPA